MAPLPGDSIAVKLTALYLRFSGFWAEETELGKRIMTGVVVYSIGALGFALAVTLNDLYHCYGDFSKFSYSALNVSIVGMGLYKTIVFSTQRDLYLNAIIYAKNNFWFNSYDDYGANVMKDCIKKSNYIIVTNIIICHGTLVPYALKPILDNRGKNESDRVLPFNFWIDPPITMTPWYEIFFAIQMFSAYHSCICFFCFDNFLCQINITLVGHFTILQEDLRNICNETHTSLSDDNLVYSRFKDCVIKHQRLIGYIDNMKNLYKTVILGIVVVLSLLICLQLYQLMTNTGELLSQIHSCIHVCSSTMDLYFFMWTCNDLAEASVEISHAAYDVKWFSQKSNLLKKQLVNDLSNVIMRSQKPCSFAVGGFSSVTLRTFTSICNTSFSYLALMRQTA